MEPTTETDPCVIAEAPRRVDPYVRLECVRLAVSAAELGVELPGESVLDDARKIAAFVEDREPTTTEVQDFYGNTVASLPGGRK